MVCNESQSRGEVYTLSAKVALYFNSGMSMKSFKTREHDNF